VPDESEEESIERLELEDTLRLLRRRLLRSERLRKCIPFRETSIRSLSTQLAVETNPQKRYDLRKRITELTASQRHFEEELEILRQRNHMLNPIELAQVEEQTPIAAETRHPNTYGYSFGQCPVAPEDSSAGTYEGYEIDERAHLWAGILEDDEETDGEEEEIGEEEEEDEQEENGAEELEGNEGVGDLEEEGDEELEGNEGVGDLEEEGDEEL
jgi:hypothetical protein